MVFGNIQFSSIPSRVNLGLIFFLQSSWLFNGPLWKCTFVICTSSFKAVLYAEISGWCRWQGFISKEKRESSFISSKILWFSLRSRAGIEFQTAVARKVFFWTEHQLEKCYKLNSTLKQMSAIVFSELETRRNWLCSITELGKRSLWPSQSFLLWRLQVSFALPLSKAEQGKTYVV